MRISDWSSDVCSSDLEYLKANKDKVSLANAGIGAASHLCGTMFTNAIGVDLLTIPYKGTGPAMNDLLGKQVDVLCDQTTNTTQRSEEHTSELQSLMRNSYAVFCLKKKTVQDYQQIKTQSYTATKKT